jgi:hypothetical protein
MFKSMKFAAIWQLTCMAIQEEFRPGQLTHITLPSLDRLHRVPWYTNKKDLVGHNGQHSLQKYRQCYTPRLPIKSGMVPTGMTNRYFEKNYFKLTNFYTYCIVFIPHFVQNHPGKNNEVVNNIERVILAIIYAMEDEASKD